MTRPSTCNYMNVERIKYTVDSVGSVGSTATDAFGYDLTKYKIVDWW